MHRRLLISILNEAALSLEAPSGQCLSGVPWETLLIDNDQVKLVLEEVGAGAAAVAIVDREVAALRPDRHVLARGGFRHVEDDGDSILIIVALNTLMRIRRIRSDQPMRLRSELGRLKVFERVLNRWCWA